METVLRKTAADGEIIGQGLEFIQGYLLVTNSVHQKGSEEGTGYER